jgi:hypothetical protein
MNLLSDDRRAILSRKAKGERKLVSKKVCRVSVTPIVCFV